MTGESTIVSKVLTPAIDKYSVTDIGLVIAAAVSILGLFIPTYPPSLGLLLVGVILGINYAISYKGNNEVSKTGKYKIVEVIHEQKCEKCSGTSDEKIGYDVYFLLGYELFRIEQLRNNWCEECTLERDESGPESQHTEHSFDVIHERMEVSREE